VEQDKPAIAEVLGEEVLGWRYEREDGSAVAQLRRNGITYSILKNYLGWDVLREEARNAWEGFRSLTSMYRLRKGPSGKRARF
jgi:uncharacterized protein (TIGR04255 family)